MAMNIAAGRGPSLSAADLADVQARFARLETGFEGQNLSRPTFVQRDGRQDFSHFWLYPALAAPGVWLAEQSGLHPNLGFDLVNVLMLTFAFALVGRRVPVAIAFLLFVGPVLWWVDKAAVEPFMFSLIAIAVMTLDERPIWSFLALGLAATQNPPVALALPFFWSAAVALHPAVVHRVRFWAGTVGAGALALLHPIYYLVNLGTYTPQVLDGGASIHVPTLQQYSAILTDLNIGLLANIPQWGIAVITLGVIPLAVRSRRTLVHPVVLASIAAGLVFLFGASQTTHFNGGSQGPSRYALWLIPLALPIIQLSERHWNRPARDVALGLATASCITGWSAYQPSQSALYLQPTQIAAYVWSTFPSLDNPLPEVFVDRTAHQETPLRSSGTPSCSKLILVDGAPVPGCPTRNPPPDGCSSKGDVCYANRNGAGYDYVVLSIGKHG